MYDYEIKKVKAANLEATLQAIPSDWELVSVVPAGEDLTSPVTGEYFLVIARRAKP